LCRGGSPLLVLEAKSFELRELLCGAVDGAAEARLVAADGFEHFADEDELPVGLRLYRDGRGRC
jgi:hypothetical protein